MKFQIGFVNHPSGAPVGARSFSISPSVSGHATWDLDVDGPLNLGTAGAWTIVPANTFVMVAKGWGGGGASPLGVGAAGGFCEGTVTLTAGVTYILTVGSGGLTATIAPTPYGGGGGSTTGQGGGYSGITQSATDLLIAAGGGGGGFGGNGGGGGGTTGQDGTAFSGDGTQGLGGTPTAGGAAGAGIGSGSAGSARLGGTGGTSTGSFSGGGGGGGHYGGGGGGYAGAGGAGGGGGGSSYVNGSFVTSPTITAAVGTTPGNSGDAQRAGSGAVATAGRLILT